MMGTADFRIEKIRTQGQLSVIRALDKLIFPADEPVERMHTMWWIAYTADGKAVAYAGAKHLTAENCVLFTRAGVVEEWRGRGVHSRLIAARLRWARSIGVDTVITYTLNNNISSANNLIRQGFRLYTPELEWAGVAGEEVLYWSAEV